MDHKNGPGAFYSPVFPSAPKMPQPPLPPREKAAPVQSYEADGKDRLALLLAWGIGAVLAGLLMLPLGSLPGLGVSVLTALWYAVLLWHRGRQGRWSRAARLLFLAVAALALSFSLWSNSWFRLYNLLGLLVLAAVQLFELSGEGRRAWYLPSMLLERLWLCLRGLFGRLGACLFVVRSFRHKGGRLIPALLGLLVALPVMGVVLPLLWSADGYFAYVVQRGAQYLADFFGDAVVQILIGLLAAPFLFSLLYALRRPQPQPEVAQKALPTGEAMMVAVALGVMDLLYLLFLAVQSAALFGGKAYLEHTVGITYAEYARSGFFQLVAVAGINLTLVLLALQFTRKESSLWRAVQVLCTAMVAMSCVLLVSAAYRMSLYVGLYGLSFKRFLTYWGMGMLAIFFTAAFLKIWRADFRFFPVAFVVGIAGWLLLNFCNVDYLVARYNIQLYLRQENSVMNLDYLVQDLSYDALWAVERLPGELPSGVANYTLDQLVAQQRAQARAECSDWRMWSLSAALAAKN